MSNATKKSASHVLFFLIVLFFLVLPPQAAQATTYFTVTSPLSGGSVSGTVNIVGTAGTAWVNVRAYVGGKPVSADVAPAGGKYSLAVNTTALPTGSNTITIIAFSVAAGQTGGTSASIALTLNVAAPATNGACGSANAVAVSIKPAANLCSTGTASTVAGSGPWAWSCAGSNGGKTASCSASIVPTTNFTVMSPASGATVSGTVNIVGTAGTAWVNVRAYVGGKPVSADVAPAGGIYSLPINTTILASGKNTVTIIAFSVAAGQTGGTAASITLVLNVQNVSTAVCGSSNGMVTSTLPTANLCSTGTASALLGNGPWTWTCASGNTALICGTAEQASMSDRFVDSIGVNLHLHNSYYQTMFPQVVSALEKSGIRHVRDQSWPTTASVYTQNAVKLINTVMKDTGVRIGFNLTIQSWNCSDYLSTIEPAADLAWIPLANIDSWEGLNEWQGLTGWCPSASTPWYTEDAATQAFLWTQVKQNPQIASIPVLGPSLAYYNNDPQLLSDATSVGNVTASMNYANAHIYPNGYPSFDIPMVLADLIPMNGKSLPVVATETGYSTAPGGPDYQTEGKYYSRLFFELFNAGIYRSYAYELIDDLTTSGWEAGFGIIDSSGNPKPAFTAIANEISILKDPGASFTPGTLSYSLTYSLSYSLTNQTSQLHHILLQKQNGRFYLILWQEIYSTAAAPTPADIMITLTKTASTVNLYDPLGASSLVVGNQINGFTAAIGDQALIYEIVP